MAPCTVMRGVNEIKLCCRCFVHAPELLSGWVPSLSLSSPPSFVKNTSAALKFGAWWIGERRALDLDDLVAGHCRWIMPMTNAYGYAGRRRDENRLDPNRDFPYLQGAANCMKTQTARAVNDARQQRFTGCSYIMKSLALLTKAK